MAALLRMPLQLLADLSTPSGVQHTECVLPLLKKG
jgi:hypothetical protein